MEQEQQSNAQKPQGEFLKRTNEIFKELKPMANADIEHRAFILLATEAADDPKEEFNVQVACAGKGANMLALLFAAQKEDNSVGMAFKIASIMQRKDSLSEAVGSIDNISETMRDGVLEMRRSSLGTLRSLLLFAVICTLALVAMFFVGIGTLTGTICNLLIMAIAFTLMGWSIRITKREIKNLEGKDEQ